jgi:DeoR family fructose operon transcriptional repressor
VLNEERRREIVEILGRDGRVLVADIARTFATSEVTIRKDLDVLHSHGLVHRTHGGTQKGLDPDNPRNLSRVVILDED